MINTDTKQVAKSPVLERNSVETLNIDGDAPIVYRLDPGRLTYYDVDKLNTLAKDGPSVVRDALRRKADGALQNPVRSVTDKAAGYSAASKNDYWSVAPYWWPNPDTPDGLPYVKRDGERVSGATLFATESENFDRTRLYEMVHDVTILALAGQVFDQRHYAECAAKHLRTWFLDPSKRMTAHLEFAQVRGGHDGGGGAAAGIVDAKDFYFLMDALRLVERANVFSSEDVSELKGWFRSYLSWLSTSKAGRRASASVNNLGVMYDLQCAAIACYLGDADELNRALRRARSRIGTHFAPDGTQPAEMSRKMPWHYCIFNLVGWTALARLARSVEEGLWHRDIESVPVLGKSVEWLVSNAPEDGDLAFGQEDLRPLHEDKLGGSPKGTSDAGATHDRRLRNPSIDAGFGPFTELTLDLFELDASGLKMKGA